MENIVGRRLALLAGWGAILFFVVDPRSPINATHAPVIFLFGVLLGPFCAWGAMLAADFDRPLFGHKIKLSFALEILSAATLGFYLVAFALGFLGVPGF